MSTNLRSWFPVHALLSDIHLDLVAEADALRDQPNRGTLDAGEALDLLARRGNLLCAMISLGRYLAERRA